VRVVRLSPAHQFFRGGDVVGPHAHVAEHFGRARWRSVGKCQPFDLDAGRCLGHSRNNLRAVAKTVRTVVRGQQDGSTIGRLPERHFGSMTYSLSSRPLS